MIGKWAVLTNLRPRYRVRISLEKIYHFSSNGSHSMETFNTVVTGKPDPKTIYGIQHSGTGKSDPETIYGQRPYMSEDHIWAKTIYGIQHSGTGKSDPEDDRIQHSWQENQTQRPYMGKDHIWDSTQWDRKIRPKRR